MLGRENPKKHYNSGTVPSQLTYFSASITILQTNCILAACAGGSLPGRVLLYTILTPHKPLFSLS